ncbi:MAG TPA: RDD family protein [Acidimicrobiia bacterium]|nr:RDD family protein [Acidimicrobiia bacterium]
MSENHYESLGADPGASRDEIRAAYRERVDELDPDTWKGDAEDRRTQASAVNRAWNVLSDPFQKERYDDKLSGGDVELTDDDEPDDDAAAPARGDRRPRPPRAAGRPSSTPSGLPLARIRARINALSVDVLVILVILFGLNFLIGAQFGESAVQVTIRDDVVRTTELHGRSFEEIKGDEEQKARAKYDKENDGTVKDKAVEVEKVDVLPRNALLLTQFATLVFALAYVTIPSLARGQSLGKRFFKIRVVSAGGAAARPMQIVMHYGLPIAVATALPLYGAIAGIGSTVWSNWDKAGQGINDKLAKTFVVEA